MGISTPTTRRFDIGCRPLRDGRPRLVLEDVVFRDKRRNWLMFAVDAKDPYGAWNQWRAVRHAGPGYHCERAGTWARYHSGLVGARDFVQALGWDLTADEQGIMAALEEYGKQS